MKNIIISLLTLLVFQSCQQDLLTKMEIEQERNFCYIKIEPCKEAPKDTLIGGYSIEFTTHKVNEPRYNPTRELADNTAVADAYDVPDVISFPAKYENLLGAKLGDDVIIEIEGQWFKYKFRDRMSNKRRYAGRADILINKDQPHWKKKGKVFLLKQI